MHLVERVQTRACVRVHTRRRTLAHHHTAHVQAQDALSFPSPQTFTTANGKTISDVDMVTCTTGVIPNTSFLRCFRQPHHTPRHVCVCVCVCVCGCTYILYTYPIHISSGVASNLTPHPAICARTRARMRAHTHTQFNM